LAEQVATKKGACSDLEDEIAMMRGTTSVLEVMETKDLEVVEGMLVCLIVDLRDARLAIKGKRMAKLDKEAFLAEFHEVENYVKENFPPKPPSDTD